MTMLNPFVCGTFHDDEPLLPSPKKSKRKDNPYSSRGLDKFSELLADLDEKRQKVYSQMNPHDISFVRFVYSNTDDFVPVVVKVKNKEKDQNNKHKSQEQVRVVRARTFTNSESMTKSSTQSPISEERKQQQTKFESVKKDEKNFSWNVKKLDIGKPSFYLPMVVILILFLLTVFGKSVATLCTCILWYVIPTLKGHSSNPNPRSSKKKKDYGRRLSEKKVVVTENEGTKKKDYVRGMSEKKMVVNEERTKKKYYVRGWSEKKMVVSEELTVSPRSGNSNDSKNKIQGKHSHKKSW